MGGGRRVRFLARAAGNELLYWAELVFGPLLDRISGYDFEAYRRAQERDRIDRASGL